LRRRLREIKLDNRRAECQFGSMRAARYLALLAILSMLAGCACLPGGGTASNALDALEQPSQTFVPKNQIPSRRF
jgi:hypothetical protein